MAKNKKNHDEEDSDNEDSEDSDNQLKVNTDNSPKIIPVAKLPDKLKCKKIVLNASDTQYPIVTQVAEQLGWVVEEEEGTGHWDVWWTDREIEPNTLYRMNLHQKINHFPGIYVLARKNLLGLHLMAMQRKFPQEYNFFPETWMLPTQFPQFRQYFQSVDEGKARTYIVKPQALSQGRGIFLTRNIEDVLNGHKYVVQRYLKNPLLLDGLKFDLRIYVLLGGSDPLRLYIYEQGLARLATRPYQQPTAQNLQQNYIHLTNYSLNKSNPEYVFNKSEKQMDVGHKRSLKAVYERLGKSGIDIEKLKGQIEECIIKTVISGLPSIRHQYQYCQPEEYQSNMCFHILGFDVMILDDLKPIVIEVNHTPSFETSTPLDYMIKKNLIKDTLKLMRITSKHKKSLFLKSKEITKKRVETGKRDILKGQERKIQLLKSQKVRDQEQRQVLFDPQRPSGYKVIFPFKDQQKNEQYGKYFQAAQIVMKDLKDMRRKIISEEDAAEKKQSPTGKGKQAKPAAKISSLKQGPMQKLGNKKPLNNISPIEKERKPQNINAIQNKEQQTQNLLQSNSFHSQQQSEKRNKYLQIIVQNNEQEKIRETIQLTKRQSNTYELCVQSQKRTTLTSVGKNNFQIRNQKNKKTTNPNITDKTKSSPITPQHEQVRRGEGRSKYQQLMSRFLRSKDLEEQSVKEHEQRASYQGQVSLEDKFSNLILGRRSDKSRKEVVSAKDSMTAHLLIQVKQKNTHLKNPSIAASINNYKQKGVISIQHSSEKDMSNCPPMVKNTKNTSKGQRNYPPTYPLNMNIINLTTKPLPIQNQRSNHQHSEQQISSTKNKDLRKQKNDTSKFGIFLQPKSYNIHETKFPTETKQIIRIEPNNTFAANNKSKTQGVNANINMASNQLCKEYQSNHINNPIPTDKSIIGRTKINLSQYKNPRLLNNAKTLTSYKNKSNSMLAKNNSNVLKDNPIFFHDVDKFKIEGYE